MSGRKRGLSPYCLLQLDDGGELAFRECGDPSAPPVVLLHGMISRSDTWSRVAADLADAGYRAIAFDLRGHGRSSRAAAYPLTRFGSDIIQALDLLGLAQIDLIGHSLGAWVALDIAARQPGRVRRLVAEEAPIPPRKTASVTHMASSRSHQRRLLKSLGVVALLGKMLRNRFDWRMAQPILRTLRQPMPAWWDSLGAIKADTLLLAGTDSTLPIDQAHALAACIANSRVAVINGGHRLHSEQHKPFMRAVREHLER